MDQQGQTPQPAAYPGYGQFVIEERNGYPQEPGAQWRIVAGEADARMEDPAYPRYSVRHPNLQGAVAEVKARLEAERERLLARAEGCTKQLAQLEQLYAPQPTPGQALTAQRERIVELLRRWKQGEKLGDLKFEGFDISFGYKNTVNLLVFNLPEYAAISARFLSSDARAILELVGEAGFTNFEHWNGAGCYSMSVRVLLGQIAGQREVEVTVDD